MKRLPLLALLLLPGALPTDVARAQDAPTPPRPPAAPWFRAAAGDPDSIRFRQGLPPEPPAVVGDADQPPAPPEPPACCEQGLPSRARYATPTPPTPPAPRRRDERLRLFETLADKLTPTIRRWIGDRRQFTPIAGELSATEERARDSGRAKVDEAVAHWVGPEVPSTWKAPRRLVDDLVDDVQIEPMERDYGTVYTATYLCDFSPAKRQAIVRAYESSVVARRLALLGGGLVFMLTCLGSVAGYIRADEATKGYYTNHLRLVAAAAVGAAGVLAYQVLA